MHLLVLISISAGAVLWGWVLIAGQQTSAAETFLFWLGVYGLASAGFIFARVKQNRLRFFDLPVFLTLYLFLRFGLVPLERLQEPSRLSNELHGGFELLHALLLVMLGTLMFWFGCSVIRRNREQQNQRLPAAPLPASGGWNFVLTAGCAIYAVGFAARSYMLAHHLYSYAGSLQVYQHRLASSQVLMAAAQFGTYGLVIFCIEKYSHPEDRLRSRLFWMVFASECGWGLMAGMKSDVLQNFVIAAVVASLVERKFRKGWIAAALAGLILLYPFVNRYRSELRGARDGVASFSAAASLGSEALAKTVQDDSGSGSLLESGWRMSVNRLDLLQSFGLALALGPRAAALRGKERWWMIPYYPFIPRFLWPSKPVLDKGARFSVALGYGSHTSTAITYPADLYLTYGFAGLLAGMFALGVAAQWLTNRAAGIPDKRRLFVYAAIFLIATNMEIDSFSYWTGLIKNFAIISIVALLVYGPRRRFVKAPVPGWKRAAKPSA